MDRPTGDRGVSEVVGFILVFGMLVISFTVYQGIVVPDQNRQVEFQHNQDVQGQLQDLRNAIVTTAATGSGQAVSVTLGASYPRRAIARNLGVSGGSLQTTDDGGGSLRVENARAIDGETADYLDGSPRSFETAAIRYTPVYSFYSNAPETVYENTLLYNQFVGANITLTDQVMIDGRRITLLAVDGSLTAAERDTVSVSTEAISVSSNRVAVTNAAGERVNLTVPTRLSATEWEDILDGEMGNDGFVEEVEGVAGADAVKIVLQPGVTYDLRMAKVGVGDSSRDEPPKYVTDVEGDGVSLPENGTQRLVVEVRDRFNNPVSNVTVDAGTPTAGTIAPTSETTDSDGRAAFTYSAPEDVSSTRDVDIDVSFAGDGTENDTVTFDVRVLDSDGSGGEGGAGTDDINPSGSGTIEFADSSRQGNTRVDVTFNNTGGSTETFVEFRVSFMYRQGGDPPDTVTEIVNSSTGTTFQDADVNVGASRQGFDTNDIDVGPGRYTVQFAFDDQVSNSFFILTLRLEDGSLNTYFVSIP